MLQKALKKIAKKQTQLHNMFLYLFIKAYGDRENYLQFTVSGHCI